jgi:hypothetical protein
MQNAEILLLLHGNYTVECRDAIITLTKISLKAPDNPKDDVFLEQVLV